MCRHADLGHSSPVSHGLSDRVPATNDSDQLPVNDLEALRTANQEAARVLHAITCQGARRAHCSYCRAPAGEPCVFTGAGPEGYHLARFAAACRAGYLTALGFAVVILNAGPDFTTSTVITPGGAR